MRIMLDTNVLISAALFPNERMKQLLNIVLSNELLMSEYVAEEMKSVVERKFPLKKSAVEVFLKYLGCEYITLPSDIPQEKVKIRDVKDYPVVYSAISGNADILLTGDKDFCDLGLNRPRIMTPAQFLEEFGCYE